MKNEEWNLRLCQTFFLDIAAYFIDVENILSMKKHSNYIASLRILTKRLSSIKQTATLKITSSYISANRLPSSFPLSIVF